MDRPFVQLVRPIVWCRATDRIRDVAQRISEYDQSCALVSTDAGLGIVTDHDFRHRVAAGEVGVDAPVSELATVPALTIDQHATQAAGLLRMVEHAIHHLVVLDETDEPVGVVRAVDLAQVEVRDPLVVRSAIEAATTVDEVAEAAQLLPGTIVALHDREVAATHIGALHAAVVDAIIRRVLQLRRDPVLAQVRYSWLVLGSLARREPLPLSDLDTALVWADPPPDPPPAESIREAAGRILDDLRQCALVPCPHGTGANNPTFSRSRAAWTAAISDWQRDPSGETALLMSAMVTDSRPLTEPELGRTLTSPIDDPTGSSRLVRHLLNEALGFRPPTGFVRDFVVEHNGEHRGQLDLKKGGLAPVAALGRWVSMVTGDARGTTPERLRRGADQGLLTTDEAQTLTGAFQYVYAMVLHEEAEALRSGATGSTFVAPGDLDSLTRRHLRESFRAIRSVQARLDEHWLARLERMSPRASMA